MHFFLKSVCFIILVSCFLTASATAAGAAERGLSLHEQLKREQALHEKLLRQREQLQRERELQQELQSEPVQLAEPEPPYEPEQMAEPAVQEQVQAEAPPPPPPRSLFSRLVDTSTLHGYGQRQPQNAAESPVESPAPPPPVVREQEQEPEPARIVWQPEPKPEPRPQQMQEQETFPPPAAFYPRPLPGRNLSTLSTLPGLEVGLQASRYTYHEVNDGLPFMDNKGYKGGIEAAYSLAMAHDWFIRGEGRWAYGTVDYSGSGSSKGNPDVTWEARAIAGKDYHFNFFTLSPYAGYGYRFLYNDSRGLTSTGESGYRRESQYNYIPLGVTHRFALISTQNRIATNVEYDYFISGRQKSHLSDVDPVLFMDLFNRQHSAWGGARGSVLYETPVWSFGPWFNHWNIGDSDITCAGIVCGAEPENKTTEIGFKVVRKFW